MLVGFRVMSAGIFTCNILNVLVHSTVTVYKMAQESTLWSSRAGNVAAQTLNPFLQI